MSQNKFEYNNELQWIILTQDFDSKIIMLLKCRILLSNRASMLYFFMLYSKENYYSTLVLCLLRCRGDRSSGFLSSDWLIGVKIVPDWSIEWTLQLRWFTLGLDDDAERVVFYEKCMSIIVIIITPNGDWNYGYILTTYNLHKQYEILGAKDIPWKHFLR